ncbi:Inositol-1-monophosphatase [Marinomonas gallaica]|uniref:Inositol-1-monophosphatase n=1 Tax=Marinomonas gallaica TaxID=1806667 RepID=A0A1C3JPX8_9GAMM|nr:inositol monophosphatase family protein [Marinomonas gallaica]SBT17165.1 Inositol-1-monophosphatase [Marinomonas gallaica]SBT19500.1 Inositol-1-monophosphatase [Marinomonas gallaica]
MDEVTVDEWLSYAKSWATHAGAMIQEARNLADFSEQYKSEHELVTSTDLAVDDYLCRQIKQTFPDHLILSEESSPDLALVQKSDVPVWVIDPIDGTINFAQGLLYVAVSIAVLYQGERWVGVVHAPFLNQTFSAIKGQGAWLNGEEIHVSKRSDIRNAIVATGFPYDKIALPQLMHSLSSVLASCQDIRRNGSAALDLCAVASGVIDAYYETVKPWDMAAGALIANEAGALVGSYTPQNDSWPSAINGHCLLVAPPDLYHSLLDILQLSKI